MKKKISHILIIGSGGREHAIGAKLHADNPRVRLYFAPGNGGTSGLGENVPLHAEDIEGIVRWVAQHKPQMTIVGPEVPLAAGLVDGLQAIGAAVFGPTQKAAQIEASKAFAKAFMKRHHIPTARFATFTDYRKAQQYLKTIAYDVVIKASGLAAGKGVIVPASKREAQTALRQVMKDREFGSAGDEVVIEEKLEGEEVSLLAFTDGKTVVPMVPAQDHKRVFDGDRGPNTGGMGAFAPVSVCPARMVATIVKTILKPTVAALRSEGRPFVGVLYAGIMLTRAGPMVLEFNCRFGDPETEVILPLLKTNLLTIVQACVDGSLSRVGVTWKKAAGACVVLASAGYPTKPKIGFPIEGLTALAKNAVTVFHAGTKRAGQTVLTSGGRVLVVTGIGKNISAARTITYKAVEKISFPGMQYRHDIGLKGGKP